MTILAQHTVGGDVLQERGRGEETFRYLMSRRYIETVGDLAGIDVALFGGVHRQCLERHADLAIVHPGAVGARWPAQYALLELDGDAVQVTFRRAPYSRTAAVRQMRAAYRVASATGTCLPRRSRSRDPPGQRTGTARGSRTGTRSAIPVTE